MSAVAALITVAMAAPALLSARQGPVAPLSVLPDNPCDLISIVDVARAVGVDVQSMERKPSIRKEVEADREQRAPDAGSICVFDTESAAGAITVVVPPRPNRTASRYWEYRSWYFKTFNGSARAVRDLGEDAWISGGTSVSVLIHDGDYFSVATQMYTPDSASMAIRVARAIVARF